MSETNGNGHKPRKPGQGRKPGSTQIAALDLQAEAVRLVSEGKSTVEIARILNRAPVTINAYVAAARQQLISAKKDYFNERIALYLDNTLNGLAASAELLSDRNFLETVDPERIDAVARTYGILSDKCFILLAGARDIALAGTRSEDSAGAPAPATDGD